MDKKTLRSIRINTTLANLQEIKDADPSTPAHLAATMAISLISDLVREREALLARIFEVIQDEREARG